jgi:hypothetical protein
MSGVFQNIDPTPPSPPGECVPPRLVRGEDTLAGWSTGGGKGGGGQYFGRRRPSSVLYICKYFVGTTFSPVKRMLQSFWGLVFRLFSASWPRYILFSILTNFMMIN